MSSYVSSRLSVLICKCANFSWRKDNLFEVNQYLLRNIKFRLAFREFGTSMGAQCQAQQTSEKERAVDLKTWSDAVIAAWDPYMELSISEGLTPEDLRPITRVMYASSLIPGGKWILIQPCRACLKYVLISFPSIWRRISRPRAEGNWLD